MEKPYFVVHFKYFHEVGGVRIPFSSFSCDISVFLDFEKAKDFALFWIKSVSHSHVVCFDFGVLPRPACQVDDGCFRAFSDAPFDSLYSEVEVRIYQKYCL